MWGLVVIDCDRGTDLLHPGKPATVRGAVTVPAVGTGSCCCPSYVVSGCGRILRGDVGSQGRALHKLQSRLDRCRSRGTPERWGRGLQVVFFLVGRAPEAAVQDGNLAAQQRSEEHGPPVQVLLSEQIVANVAECTLLPVFTGRLR